MNTPIITIVPHCINKLVILQKVNLLISDTEVRLIKEGTNRQVFFTFSMDIYHFDLLKILFVK